MSAHQHQWLRLALGDSHSEHQHGRVTSSYLVDETQCNRYQSGRDLNNSWSPGNNKECLDLSTISYKVFTSIIDNAAHEWQLRLWHTQQ